MRSFRDFRAEESGRAFDSPEKPGFLFDICQFLVHFIPHKKGRL
jgi:hypothetical protein